MYRTLLVDVWLSESRVDTPYIYRYIPLPRSRTDKQRAVHSDCAPYSAGPS